LGCALPADGYLGFPAEIISRHSEDKGAAQGERCGSTGMPQPFLTTGEADANNNMILVAAKLRGVPCAFLVLSDSSQLRGKPPFDNHFSGVTIGPP